MSPGNPPEPQSQPAGGAERDAFERAPPRSVAWNVARPCGAPCAHCLASAGASRALGGELSTMECLHLVGQIASAGAPSLSLSGGDPLVREDLETLVAHAVRRGLGPVVQTPGARLSQRRVTGLAAAGVSAIEVAVTSLDPRFHAATSHAGASLDEALSGAARCVEAGIPLTLRMLALAGNVAGLPALARHAMDMGARRLDVIVSSRGFRSQVRDDLAPAALDDALAAVVEAEAEAGERLVIGVLGHPEIDRPREIGRPDCGCGRTSCRITADGKLTPCTWRDEQGEDLRRQPFLRAWERS